LAQLEELNPDLDLRKLSVGTTLRVLPNRKRARIAATITLAQSSTPTREFPPVPPLPGTPTLRPAPLVHLERVLPSATLRPVPDGATLVGATPVEDHKAMAAQMQPVLSRSTEPEVAAPASFDPADPAKLDLLWPVATRTISSAWGPRIRTRTVRVKTQTSRKKIRQRYRGTHRGVDLTAPMGTDVYATLDGRVVEASRHKDYGNFVVLDHGSGVTTLYAHHKLNFVRTGDVVRRGQKIAEVGRTGKSTGPHLHFELRIEGVHENPLPALNDAEEIPAELMAQNEAALPPRRPRR
jgi:murein DD-endopeptidase MepM/ murein hydrolase activator NlpD